MVLPMIPGVLRMQMHKIVGLQQVVVAENLIGHSVGSQPRQVLVRTASADSGRLEVASRTEAGMFIFAPWCIANSTCQRKLP